jgi:hypothetical protein
MTMERFQSIRPDYHINLSSSKLFGLVHDHDSVWLEYVPDEW